MESWDRPAPNWGTVPNAGYDLTGATALEFWVRGQKGGEQVQFFAFGVGTTQSPPAPYPDSSATFPLGTLTLTNRWTQQIVPLTGPSYVLGGFGWEATAADNAAPITFYLDNIQYVLPRASDPRFLVSYETLSPYYANPFDTTHRNAAFVSDSSASLIALLAVGDTTRARSIADALLYAQQNDRFFTDNRVRNAYQGGDLTQPPGWVPNNKLGDCPTIDLGHPPSWLQDNEPCTSMRLPGWYDATRTTWSEDVSMVGSSTESAAWAMLALLDFYEYTPLEIEYLQGAEELGEWVVANTADSRGNGGFTAGFEGWETGAPNAGSVNCPSNLLVNGQCQRLYKSTAHNLDLYAAFSRLSVDEANALTTCSTPNPTTGAACACIGPDPTQPPVCDPRVDPTKSADFWAQQAQNAETFALSMWNANAQSGGYFWMGTQEDGVTVNQDVVPVEVQALAIAALGADAQTYLPALSYVQNNASAQNGYSYAQNNAPACGDGYGSAWFEGTSQVALAYLLAGNQQQWQSILDLEYANQASSGAMPATDGDIYSCINTGLTLNNGQPWQYYHRNHAGATAWLSLAENGVNPFNSELYSPEPQLALSTPALTFPGQNVNSSSLPLTVTLTDTGGAPLTISAITLTGDSEFSMQSTCGTGITLQPAATGCTVSVVFSPTSVGLKTATITVSDNALGNPHQISVSAYGQDFSIAPASSSAASQTISAGQTAIYTIAVSPQAGFNRTVALTCSVAPSGNGTPTCTLSPSGVTLSGVNDTMVTLKVWTTGSSRLPGSFREGGPPRGYFLPFLPAWRLGLIVTMLITVLLAAGRRARRAFLPTVMATLLLAAMGVVSCGSQATVTPQARPTPANTYTVTVSGVDLNLTHSGSVTLVVQ